VDIDTLIPLCQRLKLQGMLGTLSERLKQAREDAFAHPECLGLLLQDEIQHRDSKAMARRLQQAKFEQEKTFEQIDMKRYQAKIQRTIRELICGQYLKDNQNVLMMGPTGTGKTHLAQALGHHACRQGKSVRFIRASHFYRELLASRANESWVKMFNQFEKPDLLILDDFGLKMMTPQQAEDLYELVAVRHQKGSMIITSNRNVDSWVKLFPDPVMGNAALDRLANNAYHLILEGVDSYRKNLRPSSENS
jgi:DNA replication protein DnaC